MSSITIEHMALWTAQLETMRDFYVTHLGGAAGDLYHNPQTDFRSYFLRFGAGARLELMQKPDVCAKAESPTAQETVGWAHIALTVGGKDDVDVLTERLRAAGISIASEPRWTGDGYYESVILDPDGNRVELTAEKAHGHEGGEYAGLLERVRGLPPGDLWDLLGHDVKGMLAVIQGSIDLLRTSGTALSEEDQQLIELVTRSAERAIMIVDAYVEVNAP